MSLSPDLTHADWWIRTCTKLLQQVDTSLRFMVVKVEKTQHLMVENISEATLSKLFFLVNTDQNNNYGYLEALQVFVKDDYSRTAIPIPGFSTLANAIWNKADAVGFVEGQKTQTAFLAPLNNPYTNEPLTIPEYVDWITAVIPWAPKTFGKEKVFTLMLNPDIEFPESDFGPMAIGSYSPIQIPSPIQSNNPNPPQMSYSPIQIPSPIQSNNPNPPQMSNIPSFPNEGGTAILNPKGPPTYLKGNNGVVPLVSVGDTAPLASVRNPVPRRMPRRIR